MRLLLTTNPGLEDVAAREAAATMGARLVEERRLHGRVVVEAGDDALGVVGRLRCIHRARILLAEARVCGEEECLNDIRSVVESSGVDAYINPWTSFAVRAERSGSHRYTSMDIARVAGDAVIEAVRGRYGARPQVNLDHPAVIVAVDVIADTLYVSIELSGDMSWHRRGYRVYEHPAALKPSIASAMLYLTPVRDSRSVMDPMCGGGTIPIEAGHMLEDAELLCMDVNREYVRGAVLNARAALLDKRIKFIHGDARRMHEYVDHVDYIVSNPPYGIRLGSPRAVRSLYRDFIAAASRVLTERMTLITTEHRLVKMLAEEHGLKLVHERSVAHGNLWVKILVLEA